MIKKTTKLKSKKRYLQIALNNTLEEAQKIISQIPVNDRILIEVGTPIIKKYGEKGITIIKNWYENHIQNQKLLLSIQKTSIFKWLISRFILSHSKDVNDLLETKGKLINQIPRSEKILIKIENYFVKNDKKENLIEIIKKHLQEGEFQQFLISSSNTLSSEKNKKNYSQLNVNQNLINNDLNISPYIVADLKTMDRGKTEVEIAAKAGASAAIALGHAPIESLDIFIQTCEELGLDAMIDMMNVDYPLSILRKLKRLPQVVILHRGVDEEKFNKEKQIPLHEIRRIKSNYDILIAIAGGDTIEEVRRAIFNDADIAIVWKSFFQSTKDTTNLVNQFLNEIK